MSAQSFHARGGYNDNDDPSAIVDCTGPGKPRGDDIGLDVSGKEDSTGHTSNRKRHRIESLNCAESGPFGRYDTEGERALDRAERSREERRGGNDYKRGKSSSRSREKGRRHNGYLYSKESNPRHQRNSSSISDGGSRRKKRDFSRDESRVSTRDSKRKDKRRASSHDRRRGARSVSRTASPSHTVSTRSSSNLSSYRSDSRSSTASSDKDDSVGHFPGGTGDVINDRYVIEVEVGIGTFGKVFRCRDKKYDSAATGSATSRTGSFVAIKVVRNIPKYVSSAEIEARVLDDIYKAQKEAFGGSSSSRWRPCVKMYDHFRFRDHYCMVFECLGPSLYDVIKMRRHRGLPLVMVKHIARQLLLALDFMQSMDLVHTDLKVENVLFTGPGLVFEDTGEPCLHAPSIRDADNSSSSNSNSGHGADRLVLPRHWDIRVIDFGGATYNWDGHKSRVVNTRQYRSPEVVMQVQIQTSSSGDSRGLSGGHGGSSSSRSRTTSHSRSSRVEPGEGEPVWDCSSDVWSAGCIIAETYSGELLFPTHANLEHLALMNRILRASLPKWMVRNAGDRELVGSDKISRDGYVRLDALDSESRRFVHKTPTLEDMFSEHRSSGIVQLLRALLALDPKQRVSAREALFYTFVQPLHNSPPDGSHRSIASGSSGSSSSMELVSMAGDFSGPDAIQLPPSERSAATAIS